MPSDARTACIKEASSISRLITIWPGRDGPPCTKSFSSRRAFGRAFGPHRADLGCGSFVASRRGRSLVGMGVVDPEGVEVGFVSAEEPDRLVLGEGASGRLRLGRRFVRGVAERVTLTGPVAEIFSGLNVIDAEGEFVGIVRDTIEADDVLDSIIIEDEQGEMVSVLLEDVRSIDEWIELSVLGDTLYEKG